MTTEAPAQATTTISYEDFNKVDMRAGRITACEAVPKSELLKMQVDFGELGSRQILARIAKSYEPSRLVDLTAIFVINLAPRTMKGLESNGMVLAAEIDYKAWNSTDTDRQVTLVFLSGAVKPGTKLG